MVPVECNNLCKPLYCVKPAVKHILLKDLAKELNLSISTVSRALKDHPNISPEVRDRIPIQGSGA